MRVPRRMRSRFDESRPTSRCALSFDGLSRICVLRIRESYPLRVSRREVLLLPDRHLSLEGVDQMRACGQCLTAVNSSDCHDHSNIADLEMTDAVLYGDRQHIVVIGGVLSTTGKHVYSARVLGVVE